VSRIPVPSDRSELRSLERAIKGLSRSVATGGSSDASGDVSRFEYQYDHSTDGVGEQPVVGDTLYYDPLSKKTCSKRYGVGSVGISTLPNLRAGDSSRRYPIGKWDIIRTSDGKKWYVGFLVNSTSQGTTVTTSAIKVFEILDNTSGLLEFGFGDHDIGTVASCPIENFTMSNVVEGSEDVFGVVFGNVDTAANTISFFRLTYTAGTQNWSIAGGSVNNDDTAGISSTGFDIRHGDLIYDETHEQWLFFCVDSTTVKIGRWRKSDARTSGFRTITGKSYSPSDFIPSGNTFNIAKRLSDGNYLILDGTSGGDWLYSYDGLVFSTTGTNNTLGLVYPAGFDGVSISDNKAAVDISANKDTAEVSYTLLEYDVDTSTLSSTDKTATHVFTDNGKGRGFFETTNNTLYSNLLNGLLDIHGNIIYLDSNQDITSVSFSDGFGTQENLSMKIVDNLLYYYSDYAVPSSDPVSYAEYQWVVSQTSLGNIHTNMLPIPLGEVIEIDSNFVKAECFLETVASTSYTKGKVYSDYVALTETRAIKLNKGNNMPSNFVAYRAVTEGTRQDIIKNEFEYNQTFHDDATLFVESGTVDRYVFEFNKDNSYDNLQMNVLVNGVPYFSERYLTSSNQWHYLDIKTKGKVFANVATGQISRVYLYNL
jgi:hypothetical protein